MSRSAVKPAVRSRWTKLIWLIPASLAALALIVLAARWLRETPVARSSSVCIPGTPTCLPALR